jgi:hypothetical protein
MISRLQQRALHNMLFLASSSSFWIAIADAFFIKSTGTGGWATGFAYNENDGQSLMIAGTLYTDNFWGYSFPSNTSSSSSSSNSSNSNSNSNNEFRCFVVQTMTAEEDDETVLKSVQSPDNISPQICVGGAIIIGKNDGSAVIGAVMGTSGDSASLQMLDDVRMGQTIQPAASFDLPEGSIPVASTVSADQAAIYVAVHSEQGLVIQKENEPMQDLRSLTEYWHFLSQPPILNSYLEIIRYDYMSGTAPFTLELQLVGDDRGAVISSMVLDGDTLLVAGSTNGEGDAFGVDPDEEDDWDGYLAFVNTLMGTLQGTVRIASQAGKNDYVEDICVYGDFVYIVGTTEGNLDLGNGGDQEGGGAFVLKMGLRTSDFEYKLTIPGMEEAAKCVATAEGVYVGFYVSRTVNPPRGAINSNDVVIAKFGTDIRDSDALWTHWLDTTETNSNDIRQNFLMGMEVLDTGNVAILLNSVNLEAGLNDIVVLDLDKDTGVNDLTKGEIRPYPNPHPSAPKKSIKVRTPGGVDEDKATIWVAIAIPVFFLVAVVTFHFSSSAGGIETASPAPQQYDAEQEERTIV